MSPSNSKSKEQVHRSGAQVVHPCICGRGIFFGDGLKNHYDVCHKKATFGCSRCKNKFKSPNERDSHESRCLFRPIKKDLFDQVALIDKTVTDKFTTDETFDPREILEIIDEYQLTAPDRGHMNKQENEVLISEALELSFEIALGKGQFGKCLAVHADERLSALRSELGIQLAIKSKDLELRGIGAVIYKKQVQDNEKMLKVSLRSLNSEDTKVVSEFYGGGGHLNASSFMIEAAELEQWMSVK